MNTAIKTLWLFAALVLVAPPLQAGIQVGNGALAIAVDPVLNRIYVANNNDNTISVIDGNSDAMIATVPDVPIMQVNGRCLSVDPQLSRLYISAFGGSATCQPVGEGYVTALGILDESQSALVGLNQICTWPGGPIATDSLRHRLYLGTQSGYEVYDGKSGAFVEAVRLTGGLGIQDIVVDQDANRIFTVSGRNLIQIDGGTKSVLASFSSSTAFSGGSSPPFWSIAVNKTTKTVYWAYVRAAYVGEELQFSGGEMLVLDYNLVLLATVSLPMWPHGIAINEPANRVYLAGSHGPGFLILDGADNQIVSRSDNAFYVAVAANPQSGKVYVLQGSSSPSFVQVFIDNRPPVAQCKNATVPADASCTANASIDNGSYDPDPGDTITLSQSPAGPYPLGTTMVTLTVTDNHGAASSCSATVTVVDTTPPNITCPANIAVGCSMDLLTPVNFSATATDNCDPNPIVTYSQAPGSGFPIGTTMVACTATDNSANQSACSFTVTRAALGFSGFLSPIGGADTTGGSFANPLRTFKMGSTVPVKFAASCGGSPVLSGAHTLQAIKYSDATSAGTPIDATPQDSATTGNQFRLADGQWQFNLDTKGTGMSVGIWQLVAMLSDGSQHTVWIQFK